jgi:hypothetical protein
VKPPSKDLLFGSSLALEGGMYAGFSYLGSDTPQGSSEVGYPNCNAC